MRVPLLPAKRNEIGLTLVELLASLAVSAVIISGATTALFQIILNNTRNTAHMAAVKQVENALYFMLRDIQMSQYVQTDNLKENEVIRLSWVDWNDIPYEVSYSVIRGELTRTYSAGGRVSVCKYVASVSVSPIPYQNGKVRLSMTVSMGGKPPVSETREIDVSPRSSF